MLQNQAAESKHAATEMYKDRASNHNRDNCDEIVQEFLIDLRRLYLASKNNYAWLDTATSEKHKIEKDNASQVDVETDEVESNCGEQTSEINFLPSFTEQLEEDDNDLEMLSSSEINLRDLLPTTE